MASTTKGSCKAIIAGKTHPGLVRQNNEDNIVFDPNLKMLLLADGMGGHNAGEVASAIAVRSIYKHAQPRLTDGILEETDSGFSAEAEVLREAVRAAHTAIKTAAHKNPTYEGMGTTIVVALLWSDRLIVAHVGDSRLYRLRDGVLEQITRDHSLLEELIARGFYTPEEARKHVKKNLITRALGNTDPAIEVDLLEDSLMVGDVLLLCSDGLSDMVTDDQIGAALRNIPQPVTAEALTACVDTLIKLALDGGGKDNVSVIVAKTTEVRGPSRGWFDRFFDWFQ